MGINICIQTTGDEDHPDWDSIRYTGDTDFNVAMIDGTLPIIEDVNDRGIRPADFDAWRRYVASRAWPIAGRFERLIDILERNPDYWIYIW